ncbi:EDD domain protein, DegV family [Actinomyces bovis]|uniref:EDD domain protein, DegV family n=1 Tax=Actinomyces bovis TaxID=1658 RepID=A0ABY1VKA1_9ACTO|nr:DegV family protein [Actinomyces bovis]SPT52534.1 EDD domain protein, DegV family [Actinomyces bovis]VEG54282.1 EDD domain protein, DegV family [Actinomyces israelii]
MTLAVVTDSTACLPPALAQEAGITVVQVPVHDGTSSRPAVAALQEAYQEALQHADEVLAVHLASALSGTVDNARLAAAALGEDANRLLVLDSGSSGAGLGFAALAATAATSARQARALARESAARSTVLLLAGDLGRLSQGGRLDRGTARMGCTLGVRPILQVTGEGIRAVESVRGAARARRHLLARALRAAGVPDGRPHPPAVPVRVAVHHSDAEADAVALLAEFEAALAEGGAEVATSWCASVDAATAVHVGAGTLGIVVAPVVGKC